MFPASTSLLYQPKCRWRLVAEVPGRTEQETRSPFDRSVPSNESVIDFYADCGWTCYAKINADARLGCHVSLCEGGAEKDRIPPRRRTTMNAIARGADQHLRESDETRS